MIVHHSRQTLSTVEGMMIDYQQILPEGIRSRRVEGVNGMHMHYLEAGYQSAGRPSVLLLHGFPELAYSWRHVMPALADAGYRVVAPDQRGYGRTTGWDPAYDGDLGSFRITNLVRDALGLLAALNVSSVAAVVGHDFGSPVAAYAALIRPDIFRSVALMSAPFAGPPQLPESSPGPADGVDVFIALDELDPPRKHYHQYYSTRSADPDMRHCPQGVAAFLRAYFHYKSADWAGNRPHPLTTWSASELAKLPTYYVMERDKDMAQTAHQFRPTSDEVAACNWLTNDELAVYAGEYERNGFQGGLQWYRCRFVGEFTRELELFAGRTIDVPSCFISGQADWGVYQSPGAFESMQSQACTRMIGCHLLEGAGHWVQQERPEEVVRLLSDFIADSRAENR